MAVYKEYIKALKQCAKEHEKDITPTFQIRVSSLCNDTASLLEEDVIERSKIDRAIEEIKELPTRGSVGMDGTICRNEVLEILKRNIEE